MGCETIITKQRGSLNSYVVIEFYIEISSFDNQYAGCLLWWWICWGCDIILEARRWPREVCL